MKDAVPSAIDEHATVEKAAGIAIEEDASNGKVRIKIDPRVLRGMSNSVITTDILGKSYHAEMKFETPDGDPYRFDHDFFGALRPTRMLCLVRSR